MIEIPKKIIQDAKDEGQSILENYLISNYPIGEIVKGFAELYLIADDAVNKPQIAVTQAEYESILSLFRVKGQRVMNGEIINETRGRKPKNWAIKQALSGKMSEKMSEKTIFNSELED